LGVLGPGITIGVRFLVNFMTSLYDLTRQYFGSKFILDSRLEYESLESLIKFLAFLVQKLCQKYCKYFRNVL